MVTRKEFQEWLNQFPEDTIIEVAIQQNAGNYESYGCVSFLPPVLDGKDCNDGWEYLDFRNNQYVKPEAEHFGKTFLRIGEGK